MTATEVKLDTDLAWAILGWAAPDAQGERPHLSREQAESLARYLTNEGYTKGATVESGLVASLSYVEDIARDVSKKYLPIVDALTAKYFPKENSDTSTDRSQ